MVASSSSCYMTLQRTEPRFPARRIILPGVGWVVGGRDILQICKGGKLHIGGIRRHSRRKGHFFFFKFCGGTVEPEKLLWARGSWAATVCLPSNPMRFSYPPFSSLD